MSDGVFWPELEQWLLAHGIEPNDTAQVLLTSPSACRRDGPMFLEATVYLRNEDGHRYFGKDGEVATTMRQIPMLHLPAVEVVRYR